MKKHGFTLAEVLITLGIIGVISALVMPTFVQSTQNAKIGPKLAKAVAAFEQANKAVLLDSETDSLTGAGVLGSNANYFANLAHHLKGAASGSSFSTPDGIIYTISNAFYTTNTEQFAHQRRVSNQIMIDINGTADPNTNARDRFFFYMMDDGSLQPYGGTGDTGHVWTTTCPRNNSVAAANRIYCAGHVLENGLKVEYK